MDLEKIGKDLISIVTNSAPVLGTALGGPAGSIIGTLISNVFGGDSKDPSSVLKNLLSDPEYQIKLQQLEMEHEQTLKSLSVKQIEIEEKDRESARDYNAKINDGVVHIIAIGYSGLFAVIFVLTALSVIEIDSTIFMNIFSIAMIIVNYYFGSSHKKGKN